MGCSVCTYLGFEVGHGQCSPEDCKVAAIHDFPRSKMKPQVRSFLNSTRKYHDLVLQYATHSFNLMEATKKSCPNMVQKTDALKNEFICKIVCASPPCHSILVPSDLLSVDRCLLI